VSGECSVDASTAALAGAGVGALAALSSSLVGAVLRERYDVKRLKQERKATTYQQLLDYVDDLIDATQREPEYVFPDKYDAARAEAKAARGRAQAAITLGSLHASKHVRNCIWRITKLCEHVSDDPSNADVKDLLQQISETRAELVKCMRQELGSPDY
jgi:hypothetical protein